MKFLRIIGFSSPIAALLTNASNVFAQAATAGAQGAGATSGALPGAGTTELTYAIFLGGVVLFVFGTLKLLLSFRE